MANGKLSRAHVGLALASALIVLLASGVAISRIAEEVDESPVATGGSSTTSSLPGLGQPGPATSGGPASGAAGAGSVAEQPVPTSGEADSEESAVGHGVTRTGRKARGGADDSTSDSSAAAPGASTGSGSGSPAGSGASGGGSQGGGQDSPPAPSQAPPDTAPLATAAVSAGEGAQGAVVGIGLGNDKPAEADLTIGTNPLVGDHPPSEGTGVTFGGRLLDPPPSIPILP